MLILSGVSPQEKSFKQNQTLTTRKSDPFFFTPVSPQATSLPYAWNNISSDFLLTLLYPTILQFAPPQPAAVSLMISKTQWPVHVPLFATFCHRSWGFFGLFVFAHHHGVCFNNCQWSTMRLFVSIFSMNIEKDIVWSQSKIPQFWFINPIHSKPYVKLKYEQE